MLTFGGIPKASGAIFRYHEISIIEYYKDKALGFLNYYKPAVNYYNVKKLVDYHLRWSLLHTLAGKHRSRIHEIIRKYGKTPRVVLVDNKKELILATFLSPNEINHRNRGFLIASDPFLAFKHIDKPLVKLSVPKVLFSRQCAVMGCLHKDIEIYHIKALKCVRRGFTMASMKSNDKPYQRSNTIESVLNSEQILLCKFHHPD